MRKLIKKSVIFLSILAILTVGITQAIEATDFTPTPMHIEKTGKFVSEYTEADWFVWNDELHYLLTIRDFAGTNMSMAIYRFSDHSQVAAFGNDYGLGSTIVEDGVLHIFATKNPWVYGNGNAIYHFTTDDLINFSAPVLIKQMASDTRAWNTDVTKNTDTGEFVISYDYSGPLATKGFAQKLLKSTNLTTWTNIGPTIGTNFYAGCSYITYLDGYYYMWHLASLKRYNNTTSMEQYYAPYLMRSASLTTWTYSRLFTIRPEEVWEDINTSDVDMIEFNGEVYIFYMIGDQVTYARLTYAVFNGTMQEFVKAYYQVNSGSVISLTATGTLTTVDTTKVVE